MPAITENELFYQLQLLSANPDPVEFLTDMLVGRYRLKANERDKARRVAKKFVKYYPTAIIIKTASD